MTKRLFAPILACVLIIGAIAPLPAFALSSSGTGVMMDDRETSIGRNITLAVGKSRDMNDFVARRARSENGEQWYLIGTIRWNSSNGEVASVNEKGVVTARRVGTAKITAVAWDNFGKQRVSKIIVGVKKPPGGYDSASDSFEISAGTWLDLKQLGELDCGTKELEWSTSNADIATVDPEGMVMGLSVGRATVSTSYTSEDGEKRTVKYPVRVTSVMLLYQTRESVIVLREGDKLDVGKLYYPNYQDMPSVLSKFFCTIGDKNILAVNGMSVSAKKSGTGQVYIRRDGDAEEEICHKLTFIVKPA